MPIHTRDACVRTSLRFEVLEDRTTPSAVLPQDFASFAPDRILVNTESKNALKSLPTSPFAQEVTSLGSGSYLVSLKEGVTVGEAITYYSAADGILFAEPDYAIGLEATPNDPGFGSLWGMNNTAQTGGVSGADIEATKAWNSARGTGSTIVAVIDTGVDYTHPDLAANIWTNTREVAGDGIDNDGNGYIDDLHGYDFFNGDGDPMDDHGHGTHVAGTIGAVGNNGIGVSGVAWTTRIMVLKFIGANVGGSTSGAISAINYAVANGAKILNNSWAGGGYSQALNDAIVNAQAHGVIFVAAAGNNAGNNDVSPIYPASYAVDNVVSVAATTSTDGLASFSNFGATTVALGAPGDGIYSTYLNGGYATLSGTSMAAPHVSGALAVYWDANPNATYSQVIQRLKATTDPIASLSEKTVTGGRLNLNTLLATSSQPPAPGSSAAYAGSDAATRGSWRGAYGADGYALAQGASSPPPYGAATLAGQSDYTWAGSTADARALQKPAPAGDRLAGTWYSASSFSVDVAVGPAPRRVSLYFLDWDGNGSRAQRVDVLDAATGAVLDTRVVSGFQNGTYLSWTLTGNVRFRIAKTAGSNAVLSGIFFGGAPAAPGSSAAYAGSDAATRGSWRGAYGADGYALAQGASSPPPYGAATLAGQSDYTWAGSTADARALQKPAPAGDRLAGTWYSASSFSVDVAVGPAPRRVSLYFLDWDGNGSRAQRVDVLDAATGAVLDTRVVSGFQNGTYLSWTLTGNVRFRIAKTAGSNAVLSGLFFG